MTKDVRLLKIVVVCPGDVKRERGIVTKVAEALNSEIAEERNVQLKVMHWETDTRPGFHLDGPQGLIDTLLPIQECNVLIGIFWKRFGTPVSEGVSGTAHEIKLAYKAWTKRGQPQLFLYFCQRSFTPATVDDATQWRSVLEFKGQMQKEGLLWPYSNHNEFERILRNHLTKVIKEFKPVTTKTDIYSTDFKLTVVVGDRRERPPETPGDLFAQASSTRDLTWLFSLGLPESTVLWNDKVINATSHEAKMPEYVSARHLLVIGSPFCNLLARTINKICFFPFNIDLEYVARIEYHESVIRGVHRKEKDLEDLLQQLGTPYNEWIMKLRGNGLVDPIRNQHDVGAQHGHNTDYATISFCRHPYSLRHRTVFVAGLHLPGTMASVKALATPNFFAKHPFGGILKIKIPEGEWYERLMRCDVEWFTPAYTVAEYSEALKKYLSGVRSIIQDTNAISDLVTFHQDYSLQDFLTDCRSNNIR